MNFWDDLSLLRPEITLILGGFFILFFDGFIKQKKNLVLFAIIIVLSALLFALFSWKTGSFMEGFLKFSSFNQCFRLITLGSLIPVLGMVLDDSKLKNTAEFITILFWLTSFAIITSASNHFLPLVLGIESVSLLSYFLTGWGKSTHSKEASLKYFLFGAAASAFLIYGLSLLYGMTGTFSFEKLVFLFPQLITQPFFQMLCVFIFVGVGFKISAVPIHFWAPDAYHGAPYPAAAFLAVVPKIMGLSVMLRLFEVTVPSGFPESWRLFLMIISILTMLVGSLCSLPQSNTKRLLAWSSIVHAGLMLIPLAIFTPQSDSLLIFYGIYYALSNIGAFWCLMLIAQSQDDHESWNYLAGLGIKAPFVAGVFSLCLLSLLGLPPTAGFLAKFLLLTTALSAGHFWLFLTALITTLLGTYYYLKVIRWMYFSPQQLPETFPVVISFFTKILLTILSALIVGAGLFPTPLFQKILAL